MIKLSPSTLGLFKECPRCFWLHINKEVHRPRGKFPSLPGGMDNVIRKYYDIYREQGKLPPEIEGKVVGKLFSEDVLRTWRSNFHGVKYFDKTLNAQLKGILDDCLVDKGVLIPLDYKTRGYELKEETTSYYQHQLDAYCLLIEKNGYKVANFAYLVFYYPKDVRENGRVNFEVVVKKLKVDTKRAGNLFEDAVTCLKGPEPKVHTECEYCTWGIDAFGD